MKLILFLLLIIRPVVSVESSDSLRNIIKDFFNDQSAPGAVVIWVQNDSTLVFETMGFANISENRVIDPDSTIFRIGSISKALNAIGVLNRVEASLLQLDEDINSYFDDPLISARFKKPVTLRHLLTHTAGFDDKFIGKSSRTREDARSLKDVMQKELPVRIIGPGEISSYSNFGAALSGYLAEHVSGLEYSELMDSILFRPLGMYHSSFDPDYQALRHFMTGYFPQQNGLIPLDYDYLHDAPAGTMVSTAHDMNRFLKVILDADGLEKAGVLSREMREEMMRVQFTHHPALSGGFGYLWNIFEYSGHRVIGHDGGYIGSAARLFLLPDHNTAMFIAVNMMDFTFISRVTELIISSFLPDSDINEQVPSAPERYTSQRPLHEFAGTWRNTRYSKHSFTKFGVMVGIMGQEINTGIENDTLLTLPKPDGSLHRMVKIGPNLFESIDGGYRIAFRENGGKITHLFTSGTSAFERLHPFETTRVQIPFLIAANIFFSVLSVIYIIVFLVRKIRNITPGLHSPGGLEFAVAFSYSSSFLLYLPAFAMIPEYEIHIGFGYGMPWLFYIITVLPYVALGFTLLLAIQIFKEKRNNKLRLVFSLFVILFSITLFLSLDYWNLAGWKF
ncbi:MAG: class A beta-lactamase-related serine hydrolase [Balneolaceae bacterium]|nr:MAG: class A beta-lactamase-related serine hydrolase [Balneolaceae bacterium]